MICQPDEPLSLEYGMLGKLQDDLFPTFIPAIKRLPRSPRYTREMLVTSKFRLAVEGSLTIYYAPFDFINRQARVVLVGLTPGWQQMEIAYRVARQALGQGIRTREVCRKAKAAAAFAGTMRTNLCAMLDDMKIPKALDVPSSASLFESHAKLLHSTSALRYPVFAGSRNYTGHGPNPLSSPLLKSYIDRLLGPELASIEHALVIPFGKSVTTAIEHLISSGIIDSDRCCLGFPHPSGANGHRAKQFQQNRDQLRRRVQRWALGFD